MIYNILLMQEMKVYALLVNITLSKLCVKYLHHTIFFQKARYDRNIKSIDKQQTDGFWC